MTEENLLTMDQAAKTLGVKAITLRKWDREGKLKAIRIGSRKDRKYKLSDLHQFITKSNTNIDWYEAIRNGAMYRHLYPVIKGMEQGCLKEFGHNVKNIICFFKDNTLFWYYDKKQLYDFGHVITQKLADKAYSEDFFRKLDQSRKQLLDFIDKNPVETIKDFASVHKKLSRLVLRLYDVYMSIDGTDESLMIDITHELEKLNLEKKEFIRIYNILSQPNEISYLSEEQKELLIIAQDIISKKIHIESEVYEKRIAAHAKKYWWTPLGWNTAPAKSHNNIKEHLQSLLQHPQKVAKEILELESYTAKTIAQKDEVIKTYHLSKKLQNLLTITEKLFVYHDLRKEAQMKYNYYETRMLDLISKNKKVPRQLLDWCDPKEIQEFLITGAFDEHELNQRSASFIYATHNGVVSRASGILANKIRERLLASDTAAVTDVQGMTAYPGKAVGRAHVALTVATAMNIQQGDILITGMTTPDFLPAMKKAAAILTDEGGITCHAAIVARELKIPCLVGTRCATRTFVSGQTIEVSANHGVARLLHK